MTTDAVFLRGAGTSEIVAVTVLAEGHAVNATYGGFCTLTVIFRQTEVGRMPLGAGGMAADAVPVVAEAADLGDAAGQVLAVTFETLARRVQIRGGMIAAGGGYDPAGRMLSVAVYGQFPLITLAAAHKTKQ